MKNIFDLTGKTAFITGGAGLLGKKHAEAIISMGGIAIIADSNIDAANEASNKLGTSAIPLYIDVNKKSTIEEGVKELENKDIKINILINNAANNPTLNKTNKQSTETRFETMSEEYWINGISTILNGAFLCSQVIGNSMISNGGGVMLNIASDLGVIAPDQRIYKKDNIDDDKQIVKPITYCVAKSGIIGMTKYLATYFADKNIRVNSLSPGGVYDNQPSDFIPKLTNLIPMGRMANVDEYMGAIIFLCSDASSYMTGTNLIIDGGRTCW